MKVYLSESINGTKAGMLKRLEDYHQGIFKLNKTSMYYVFVG